MENIPLIVLKRSNFSSNFDNGLFENIAWSIDSFNSHHQVSVLLKDNNPYTITVIIESLRGEFRDKRKYVKRTKLPIVSKYKELLFDYFFEEYGQNKGNDIYGKWIKKYDTIYKKEKYDNVDEYIIKHELQSRYKQQILSRFKNHQKLMKDRIRIDRERLYNLPYPLNHIDYRNFFDNIFIWYNNGKKVARRGGSGSSGARETNSKFIYGLLELNKIKPVPSYIFLYSEKNKIFFVRKFNSLCVPDFDIGLNYSINRSEQNKLKKQGLFLYWKLMTNKIMEVEVRNYFKIW